MKMTIWIVLASMVSACSGAPDSNKDPVNTTSNKPTHSKGDIGRPGRWRRFLTGSASGLIVGGVAMDAEGARLLLPKDDGYDIWKMDLDCRSFRMRPLEGLAIRGGAQPNGTVALPPAIDSREVQAICMATGGDQAKTLEQAAASLRR